MILTTSRSYRVDLRPLACWYCWFESRREHGCLSLVSVVCCHVKVSATGRSLECVLCVCVCVRVCCVCAVCMCAVCVCVCVCCMCVLCVCVLCVCCVCAACMCALCVVCVLCVCCVFLSVIRCNNNPLHLQRVGKRDQNLRKRNKVSKKEIDSNSVDKICRKPNSPSAGQEILHPLRSNGVCYGVHKIPQLFLRICAR